MKRMMKRLVALMSIFLMGLGCIAPAQTAYAANFITFNQTIQDSYGVKTSIFQVDNTYAFCCEAMKPTPYRDMQVYISESTNPGLLKVLWYGTKGPGAVLADNNDGYMITSQAASLALGNGRVHSRYETWYNEVITYAAPPSGFKAYIATPVNSTYQALAFSVYYPEGSAYLTKSSSDTSFSGNSGYSLANAVYGVYTDSACSSEVATFTTGSDGVSNTITLDAGTYYVKEKSAPQGFELDTTVHTLVVESGSTKNLTVSDTPKGRLKLLKQSSDAGFSSGSEYSLAGAEYSVYTESACTSAVGSFTTDAYGNTGEIILSQGTYYVKETKAPQGFELDTTVYPVTVTAATTQTLTVTDVPKGKLTLVKESTDASISSGNKYSLNGAEYVVYGDSACTNAVGSFVTDSRGMTDEIILGAGTYYVKEVKAPMGFELDTVVHSVNVVAGQVNTFRAKDVPLQGKLSFLKKSSNPEITDGNSCYSLAGAKFGVYKDAAKTQLVGTLITNANGKTADLTLPLGKYYVKELEAPKGFALCKDFTVEVVVEGVVKEVVDIPQDDPVFVLLQKVDASTGKPVAVGGANLAGAEYTFKYYDGIYSSDPAKEGIPSLRSWIFKTDSDGYIEFRDEYKVSGDAFYYNSFGIPTLPLGTLTIQETKAPEGYKINPEVYVRTITAEGTSSAVNTYNQPITPETVQRGDVEFIKIDAKTQKRMANVKFRLTETTTGESHILITDENGKASTASSWNKHSSHTNRGERSSDGIWFGLDSEGNMSPVDDNVGALPYGTYKLEELQCDANKGYDLFDHIIFKIDSDEKVVNLGSLENHFVELDTVALDKTTNSHHSHANGEVTIVDTVYYEGLTAGKTYKLMSKVMDTATGQVLNVNGEDITLEKEFSPVLSKSFEQTTFKFTADDLAGKTIVVTQELYRDGILISSHVNLNDEDQMIRFPKIGTSAVNAQTNSKFANAAQEIVIEDKVSFENVIPNKHYVLKGKLMNADTGESIKVNGKEVIVEKEFRTKKSSGTETVEFVLNDLKLAGHTITVFEVLYDEDGAKIASHEVLNDSEQTIYIPKIGTAAVDSITNDHVMKADKKAIIVDKVEYSGLMPGKEYSVSGVLMNKETGKALLVDGREVTANAKFTATDKKGAVDIKFEFDASEHAGTTVVVFEDLYYGLTVVASHKDIEDDGQTVYIPEISTSAVEGTFNDHVAVPVEKAVITDTVTYTNLLSGKEYKVDGVLMDKATGKALLVNGKEITATKTFTATKSEGTVELVFEFDSRALAGKTIVAFESISYKGVEIAVHKDITDAEQSIYYPSIGTSAIEGSLDDQVAIPKKKAVITDTVSYTNLPVGEKFTLSGILMDKATEQPLLVDGKEVTASISFRTTKSNGSEKLKFEFDSSALEGKTLVVYETLIYDGEEVTAHKDINDEGQTIYYPSIGTSAVEDTFDKHIAVPSEKTVVTDTVTYTNLMPGKEYTVKGVLMNKETGKPLLVDGKNVTAEKKFVPTSTNGSVELEFTFNSSALKGTTVVVFESLYYKNTEITVHKDISDAEQSIYYPSIGTMAVENSFDDHMALSKIDTVITDTVSYTDLPVGETFKVRGTLMDKETGKALLVDGKEVIAEKEFKAVKENGTIEMKFEFDSSAFEGITLVVFEELLYENTVVAVHKDLDDREQSIYYPSIGTTAIEGSFNDHVAIPAKDAKITDTVAYKNMPVGAELTVKGVLMDKLTGKALLIDGKEVIATKTFTTKANEGAVELEFKFDASAIEGTTVVVFEEVVYKNTVVAEHKDLTDEGQTVHFPKIRTEAKEDSFAIGNLAVPNETMTIKDKVSFTNLLPSKEYTVSGVLMNKETGKPLLVNDKEIRAEKTFTAAATEGFVELEFEFDASALAGTTIVVFEELLFNNTVVVTHKDLEDAAQTIFIPAIHTNAIDKDSEAHKAIVGEENVIIDTVTYESLVSGEEYTVKGYLVDKATKEPLMADEKRIESEVTFKAEANDGEVKLDFVIPGNVAGGKEIVVFEELYYEDTLIASHKDIDDANQTVKYDYTSVIVNKTDMKTEKALAGAKLQLIELVKDEELSTEGNIVYEEIVVEEWITDGNPYECKNIKNGLYLIREVETPDGYVTCENLTFEKINAYDELEFNVKDDIIKLEISKKDAVDKSEIKGAKMQILNADGKVVEKWTTDGKIHRVEYLPVGSYTLVEKEAPFGYVLSEPIEFEVKDTAEVQVLEMLDARTQGYIKIEKLSSVNRKALAGAEFEFRNKDGEVIETLITDENGNVQSKSVDIGIYENGEFKEFAVYYLQETVAPEGYQLDDTVYEIKFGYLGDNVPVVYKHYKIPNIKVVIEEPVPEWELVPTGDNTQYLTYLALMAAAFVTMLVVYKKRTNKEI